jgi:hypothetical protein
MCADESSSILQRLGVGIENLAFNDHGVRSCKFFYCFTGYPVFVSS